MLVSQPVVLRSQASTSSRHLRTSGLSSRVSDPPQGVLSLLFTLSKRHGSWHLWYASLSCNVEAETL